MTKAHIGLVTIASILVASTATLVLFGNSDKKITTAPPANKNMIAEKVMTKISPPLKVFQSIHRKQRTLAKNKWSRLMQIIKRKR